MGHDLDLDDVDEEIERDERWSAGLEEPEEDEIFPARPGKPVRTVRTAHHIVKPLKDGGSFESRLPGYPTKRNLNAKRPFPAEKKSFKWYKVSKEDGKWVLSQIDFVIFGESEDFDYYVGLTQGKFESKKLAEEEMNKGSIARPTYKQGVRGFWRKDGASQIKVFLGDCAYTLRFLEEDMSSVLVAGASSAVLEKDAFFVGCADESTGRYRANVVTQQQQQQQQQEGRRASASVVQASIMVLSAVVFIVALL